MTRQRKVLLGIAIPIVVIAIAIEATVTWKNVFAFVTSGLAEDVLRKTEKTDYVGSNEANLKALHTALMLYHDNEDRFPEATGWMDAIKNQLRTNTLKPGEELKKLKVDGAAAKEYGFAFAKPASGKFKDDLKPSDILIYMSNQTTWNASGDPTTDRKGLAITIAGELQK